ncbi:MAG TPA: response regulator transcription factor [Candidatus Angelobacter sp.]|nr:response regulator transcription factor [Candidatus Angelobacter sp.]
MAPDLRAPIGRRAGERAARVLVIDDHHAVAEAVAMAIDTQDDLDCVGTAGSIGEGRRLAAELHPDVILIDVELPDGDGIEAVPDLRRDNPRARVLVLTGHTAVAVLARAASAGVCGFLPKESGIQEVLRAIRVARDGGMIVNNATLSGVLNRIAANGAAGGQSAVELFTPRELDVLRGLASGSDPQNIAQALGMSVNTCRGHVKSILSKLGAHSQLEAVVIALRRGLLPELLGA